MKKTFLTFLFIGAFCCGSPGNTAGNDAEIQVMTRHSDTGDVYILSIQEQPVTGQTFADMLRLFPLGATLRIVSERGEALKGLRCCIESFQVRLPYAVMWQPFGGQRIAKPLDAQGLQEAQNIRVLFNPDAVIYVKKLPEDLSVVELSTPAQVEGKVDAPYAAYFYCRIKD